MADTRTIAQEVQEQLVAAAHRGQKQLRRGQEQLRKGRESVTVVIRTGNELAKAVRSNIPARQGRGLQLPQIAPPSAAKLREQAQGFAGQVAARQRNLADRALQAATPLVTDGVARLNKVVSLLEERDRREAGKPAVDGAARKATAAAKEGAPKRAATPRTAATKTAPKRTAASRTAPKQAATKPTRARSTSSTAKASRSTKPRATKPKA